MSKRTLGVIGGSGIYELEGLTNIEEITLETPFGAPSAAYIVGQLGDTRMVFLARHGQGHTILPHEINYRANIFGMKKLGVDWLVSLSAVGSMKAEIKPGDMVVVDQFIDKTNGRSTTFYGDGIAAHVSFGDPVSPRLADLLYECATEHASQDITVHRGGTYVVMNGPQFSTRAESELHRSWGVSVIGMTNMPEAKLAREAEISYATLALATDYDCWHEDEADVSVEAVVAVVQANAARARKVVAKVAEKIPSDHDCIAANALAHAIMTAPDHIPAQRKTELEPLLGKYIK